MTQDILLHSETCDIDLYNILPPLIEGIEACFNMETINYEYSSNVDEFGEREIIDVSRVYQVKMNVPKISFIEWIETLCALKKHDVVTTHLYAQDILPYDDPLWGYFNQVKGNLLTNGHTLRNQDKVRMYLYYIDDFKYFVIIRLLSHFQ